MGAEDLGNTARGSTPLNIASIARDFERVRRGYDPAAVDHHLALITSQIKTFMERQLNGPDESLDLVLRATRRSVDEALQDARDRADAIVAEAEAEALTIEEEAARKRRELDADARERYAEMVRLAEERAETLAVLDSRIAERQAALRTAADELLQLAASVSGTIAPARGIAAMERRGIEVVLPVEPGSDA